MSAIKKKKKEKIEINIFLLKERKNPPKTKLKKCLLGDQRGEGQSSLLVFKPSWLFSSVKQYPE